MGRLRLAVLQCRHRGHRGQLRLHQSRRCTTDKIGMLALREHLQLTLLRLALLQQAQVSAGNKVSAMGITASLKDSVPCTTSCTTDWKRLHRLTIS